MENIQTHLDKFKPIIRYENALGRTSQTWLRFLFLIVFIACIFTIMISSQIGDGEYSDKLVGSALIFFALWLEQVMIYSYHNSFYFKGFDSVIGSQNKLAIGVSYEVAQLLLKQEDDTTKSFVTSKIGQAVLLRCGVNQVTIANFLNSNRSFVAAKDITLQSNRVTNLVDIGTYIYMYDLNFQSFLQENSVRPETYQGALKFVVNNYYHTKREKRWWGRDRLSRHPGLGRELSSGVAYELNKFSLNIYETDLVVDHNSITPNHREIIQTIEKSLARSRAANVLLVSQHTTIAMDLILAVQNRVKNGEGLNALAGLNFLVLDTQHLLSSFPEGPEMQYELELIFSQAANAGNMVILIESISEFIIHLANMGISFPDLMDIYLSLPTLHIIAIDTSENFHQELQKHVAFLRHFEEISIGNPDTIDTIKILEPIVLRQEKRRGVFFTYDAITTAASGAERYLTEGSMPERAIDLIHDLAHSAQSKKSFLITKEDVQEYISAKTGVPVGPVSDTERTLLLNLEDILHTRIIGQHKAVKAIAGTMRRARVDINRADKPIGSFLFLGSTGVGKTETAKALAHTFFGSEENMLRFDMTEFNNEQTLDQLIGDGNEKGLLTNKLNDNPYCVLLLDEFEKADESIHDLFLQILDEGYYTDRNGEKVNARNTIIIATSNAASELISKTADIRNKQPILDQNIIDHIVSNKIFKPELINRFDNTIIFEPLDRQEQKGVIKLLLADLTKRLEQQNYHVKITAELENILADLGYTEKYGGRGAGRVLQNILEQKIADKILEGVIQSGGQIILSPEDFSPEELSAQA